MSKISLSPDASGTGIFTIASPNSNTNRTLTLPDDTGTIVTNSGNQAGSFTTLNTSGAVVFNDAGADVDFRVEGDTDANLLFVDASADAVGVGTSSPAALFQAQGVVAGGSSGITANRLVAANANPGLSAYTSSAADTSIDLLYLRKEGGVNNASNNVAIAFGVAAGDSYYVGQRIKGYRDGSNGNGGLIFETKSDSSTNTTAERVRITSGGYFKASNDGTYVNSTSSNHEFKNTTTATCVQFSSTSASFAQNILIADATPSASSSYVFLLCRSAVNADNEFNLRGDGNAYADGTWNNNGADYAEFFESVNGQALTLGATVVLDGNKVREATDQDPASAIIGVVRPKEPSKASMVVGNTAWNKWANKYLTDDFDRYIMEDHDVVEWEEQVLEREAVEAVEAVVDEEGIEVSPSVPAQEAVYKTVQHSYESHNIPAGITVPADATRKTHDEKGNKFQHYKLNPEWNPDSEYVNRENRPEWNIIGLLGQVKILKGQPVGDRWVKMRDISEAVEEWMIR